MSVLKILEKRTDGERSLWRLVRCVRALGLSKGVRYWRIENLCIARPAFALQWAAALEAEALSHEANGVTQYATSLRGFAADIRERTSTHQPMKPPQKSNTQRAGVDHQRLVLLWLRFRMWLRWRLWRGKVCPGTGKRCRAINCNISPDNCYVTYAKWKQENTQVSTAPQSVDQTPEQPLTREEILILKIAQLQLHRGFVDAAARALLRGVRPSNKAQDLVLRADLEELKRRCDDAANVSWPVLPNIPQSGTHEVRSL